MPITIKHGERDMSAVAQLALLLGAGQAQTPQMPAWRPAPVQIPGGGGGGRGTRTSGLQTGQGRLRRPEPSIDEKLQAQAKARAEEYGLKLSVKDEQLRARNAASRAKIAASPDFTSDEKVRMDRQLQMDDAQYVGTVKDDKFKWPKLLDNEGQEIQRGQGNIYRHPQSGALLRDVLKDGQGVVEVVQRYDQGPEAEKRKADAAAAVKIADVQAKQQERNDNMVMDLLTEETEVTDPKNPALKIKQRRKPEDVKRIMQDYLELTGQLRKPGKDQPEEQADTSWAEEARAQGIDVQEKDLDIPPKAGQAQAILRTLKQKYEGKKFKDMTEEEQILAEQAAAVLERFERYKKSQAKQGKRWR